MRALAGRERELAALSARLDALPAGAGRVVLVGGEAGIGKSALLRALAEDAAKRGVLVAAGGCYDLSVTPPYGPWSEVAEALDAAGEATPPGDGGFGDVVRRRIAEVAARRSLLVILDDIHWADAESLELLRVIARDAGRQPFLLVGGYRDDELGHEHPLASLLPALAREAPLERITLRPLDAPAVQALVAERYSLAPEARARLVAYSYEQAGGNPFYLLEVLRELEDDGLLRPVGDGWSVGDLESARLPPFVRQVIERRLARLGESARMALQAGAAIGRDVQVDLWLGIVDLTIAELDAVIARAIDARLLELAGPGNLRFSHALVQETLYHGLTPLWRRELHRDVAEALALSGRADPSAIAHHFRQAGDPRTVDWLIRAALHAERRGAHRAIAEYLETAAALLEGVADAAQRRGRLLFAVSEYLHHSAAQQTLGMLDEVERLARMAGDRAFLAAIQQTRALVLCSDGSTERGIEEYQRASALWARLTMQERRDASLTIARPLLWLERSGLPGDEDVAPEPFPNISDALDTAAFHAPFVFPLALYGRIAEGLAIGSEVASQIEALPVGDDVDLIVLARSNEWLEAYIGLGVVYALLGQVDASRAALARASDSFRAAGLHLHEGVTALMEIGFATIPYLADVAEERAAVARRAEAAWGRARDALPPGESPRTPLFELLALEGAWDEAWQLAETARAQGHPGWRSRTPSTLAQLAHLRGDTNLAWSYIAEMLPEGPDTRPGGVSWRAATALQRVAVESALDAGDLASARAWLAAHDAWLAWSGAVLGRADGRLIWAGYLRATGDISAATRAAEDARELAIAPRQPLALLGAQHLLGEFAIAAGNHAAAEQHLGEALALAAACDAPFERARCLLALAELRLVTGEPVKAQTLVTEAGAMCTRLGAKPALARVAALEARCAAPAVAERPAGLTARELGVLRLIAAGRSNREIAAELAMSVRTAERHIANVYLKIDANGRAEAIAFAHRNGLV